MPDTAPNSPPFWSVMIPTYRAGTYLRECLESVLSQDPGPTQMQIEVVDDASPPGGTDIADAVRQIAGDRVAVFRQPANLGLAGNWNSCLDRARGRWVHLLHQDDKALPGFYAALRAGVEGRDEAVQAAVCRHAFVRSDGSVIEVTDAERDTPGVLDHDDWVRKLAVRSRVQCAAIVARRSLYDRVGRFRSDLSYALDWEMYRRMAIATDFWYEPRTLAWWRVHDAAATPRLRRTGENVRDLGRSIDIAHGYLPAAEADALSAAARLYYARWALWIATGLMVDGDVEAAHAQAREAVRLCPTWPVRRAAWRLQLTRAKRWATRRRRTA